MTRPFLLLSTLLATQALGQGSSDRVLVWDETSDIVDWQRAIRDFRREHNFSILAGRTISVWDGHLDGVTEYSFLSQGYEFGAAYAFHIPWTGGFGYTLGTSASVIAGEKSRDDYQIHYRARLPGVELGLVYNINQHFRLNATLIYGWERVDQLRLPKEFQHRKLSLTGETLAYRIALDYFYQLTWAVRVEFESSEFCYTSKQSFCYYGKETHELEKISNNARIGIVKHLL